MPAAAVSPIVAALDQPEVTLDRVTIPTVAVSLVEAFAQIPDPRKARGIRQGVLTVMLVAACAVLTGARSFAAIAEYAHDSGRTLLDLLGVGPVVPHASTIRRVLQDLDPTAVEAAMRTWTLGPARRPGRTRRSPGPGAAPGAGVGRQDRARCPHPPQPRHRRLPAAASGVDARSGQRRGSRPGSGRSQGQRGRRVHHPARPDRRVRRPDHRLPRTPTATTPTTCTIATATIC